MLTIIQRSFDYSAEILSGAGYALTLSIFLFLVMLPICLRNTGNMHTKNAGNFMLYFGSVYALTIFLFGFGGALIQLSPQVLPFAIAFSHVVLFLAYLYWAVYVLATAVVDSLASRI